MKNICPRLIFMLVLLPQVSFGADQASVVDPRVAACNKIEDVESNAFFAQQVQERAAWIKAHQALIAKQDLIGTWGMAQNDAQRTGSTFSDPIPPPLTSEEQSIFDAFKEKQQSDKEAFFSKFYPERDHCLHS